MFVKKNIAFLLVVAIATVFSGGVADRNNEYLADSTP